MGKHKKVFQSLTLILQLGLNMIVPIIFCMMIGVWISEKYNMPIVTIVLFLMGALAGFTNCYKMIKKMYGLGKKDGNKKC